MNKTLGIVITYKETKLTEKAIKSLVNAGVDVALVFNGWKDKFLSWLEKNEQYIDYKFLNEKNLGFCKGNNQAMKLAIDKGYDYAFLLNNDAWVEPDCIELLIKEARRDKKVGMLQPKVYKAWNKKLLDTTGLIFRYGKQYSWELGLGYVIDRGQNEIDEGQYDNITNILGCCGCAVLYKIKMLKQIGLFWEKLWSLCEDVELSWRAYKYDWKAKYVPDAIAYHWRGYLSKKRKEVNLLWDFIGYRNWVLVLKKHGNNLQKLFATIMWNVVGWASWTGKRLKRNKIGGFTYWVSSFALWSKTFERTLEKYYSYLLKSIQE